METAYLSSGEKVIVHEKVTKGYVVEKVVRYEQYETESVEEYGCGVSEIVGNVYKSPPRDVYEKQYEQVLEKLNSASIEYQTLVSNKKQIEYQIANLSKTKIDKEEFILDLSDFRKAKSVAFFSKDSINPVTDKKEENGYGTFRGTKITISIKVSDGTQNAWGCRVYDEHHNWDHHIEENGIVFDKTEEELLQITKERANSRTWNDGQVLRTPDYWLSESLLKRKKEIHEREEKRKIEEKKSKVESLRKEADALENELKTS